VDLKTLRVANKSVKKRSARCSTSQRERAKIEEKSKTQIDKDPAAGRTAAGCHPVG